MTDQEKHELRHDRRKQSLQRLHDTLRQNATFSSRSRIAVQFWQRKDQKIEYSKTVERNQTAIHKYPLAGWCAALREWAQEQATPQAVDIAIVAHECQHWTLDDRDAVRAIVDDCVIRMEARYAKRTQPLPSVFGDDDEGEDDE